MTGPRFKTRLIPVSVPKRHDRHAVKFVSEKFIKSFCEKSRHLYLCAAYSSKPHTGGVPEWFNGAVLKTVVLKGTGSSNLSSSA